MKIKKLKHHVLNILENELSEKLTYHGVHHTVKIFKLCEQYADREKITAHEKYLLFTAALMHDTGFLTTYDKHEEESIRMVEQMLPEWNYTKQEIEIIAGIIRATKIPQQPTTLLEQIIGDADLDYLGTELFYPIGETLYNELLAFNKISTRKQWDEIQLQFLRNHQFHTSFAKKYREPVKIKHLKEILKKMNTNN